MSLGTSNRDGGKTSESGHLRALAKMVNGDVLEGLAVAQRGAGANMSVDVAIGDALIRRSDGSYAHPVFNDAVYNQVITAADGSNPRRDLIVLYVDYGQAPSTAVSNNTNGVVKIKVVTGTPAGSPVDPNGTAIQSSVGAGNPYTILARVRVPAGQTSITNSLIDDLRSMITAKLNSVPTIAVQDLAITNQKIAAATLTLAKLTAAAVSSLGDFSTSEIATPFKWTDGRTIYMMTVTGSVTNSASEQIFGTAPMPASATMPVKVEGGIFIPGSKDFWPFEYMNPGATTLQNAQMKISNPSGAWQIRFNTGGSGTLICRTFYVK